MMYEYVRYTSLDHHYKRSCNSNLHNQWVSKHKNQQAQTFNSWCIHFDFATQLNLFRSTLVGSTLISRWVLEMPPIMTPSFPKHIPIDPLGVIEAWYLSKNWLTKRRNQENLRLPYLFICAAPNSSGEDPHVFLSDIHHKNQLNARKYTIYGTYRIHS